jgi:hypothetical protein
MQSAKYRWSCRCQYVAEYVLSRRDLIPVQKSHSRVQLERCMSQGEDAVVELSIPGEPVHKHEAGISKDGGVIEHTVEKNAGAVCVCAPHLA